MGPVFALDLRGTCLYRRRGFCTCSTFGRGGLLYFGARRWNDRHRGGPDLLGAHLGAPLRGPVLLAGGLTALVGVLIVAGWPENSFVILGILLGLDLLFWGVGVWPG